MDEKIQNNSNHLRHFEHKLYKQAAQDKLFPSLIDA